jgi:plasmid stability protein
MTSNLSIKAVPDDIVAKLRARAERHHRSMQGERMAILEEAVDGPGALTPAEVLAEVRGRGLSSPSESTAVIRAGRDGR